MEAREFHKQYSDAARTVILPSLSLTDAWHQDGKTYLQPFINGAFVFQNGEYRNWMSSKTLAGARWMSHKTPRSLLHMKDSGGSGSVDVAVWNVKPRINAHVEHGLPVFDVLVKGNATLLAQSGPAQNVNRVLGQEIQNEIRSTFSSGVRENVDVLNLENSLYRWHNHLWKQTFGNNRLSISKRMLGNITVDIKVEHAGRLRLDS
jgi:spore germination protein KC